MKLDEQDLGRDRGIEFETDDEENQAEMDCEDEDDTESDCTVQSSIPSNECMDTNVPSWPQSYRQSMDLYSSVNSPSVGFLRGTSLIGESNSFLSQAYKRPSTCGYGSSMSKPLISPSNLDKEEVHPFASSGSRFSATELPPSQQCSFAQATLNVTNVFCGIGLLTTPYAIKEGGWSSLLLLLVFGVIACYTGILLKRCLDSSPGLHTFPDIGQAAFGKAGRLIIAIILYLDLYSCSVEYIIMMGDNMAALFPNTTISFAGIFLNPSQTFAVASTLVILPTVWLRNLSLLSYLSAGGVITSVLVALCLLWVGVVDKVGFHPSGTAFDLANLPVTIGIVGFCYSGHTVLPNIYSSMKKPSQFPLVLIASFGICWFLYAAVAICGFLMFGALTKSQFTLNMPKEFVASKLAVWTSVMNPISKFALTITPVALGLEELLPPAHLNSQCASILIRTILVFSCLVVALTVPFFGFVMALIGSFLAMLVVLVFPCACYLMILKRRLSMLQSATCVAIAIMGLMFSCVGTYSAIAKIVNHRG